MKHVSGGYYIIDPCPRPEGMDETLVPPIILSLSEYFCKFHPDTVFVTYNVSVAGKRRYARQLGLPETDYAAIEKWVEDRFAEGLFTYSQVFMTLATARDFCARFLTHVPEPLLVGIGLPEELVQYFLTYEGTLVKPDKERYGFEKLLLNGIEVEKTGATLLGYELLAFEYGAFITYLFNGQEREYDEHFDFKLNEHGLIPSLEEAMRYAKYSNDESEEYFWLPWAIFSYSR
ncbi:hypothetical protein QWY16_11185 [Planococcus shenhongbingii]|uniref:hypothetical protein n=1 Tax=Planococcus shenhongbingii TaxID=3058398 RepID=UPI00261ACBEF|nr:hypothetical protein [Planococcus sp. N016]WKA57068.1 hypothetical protein QWY16_11185 [Planococcus sp. N016]